MVMCWAYGCSHYNNREPCKFFRFPKDETLRKKWIKCLRRTDLPGKGAFVCSCHFRDGKKENLPEIFSFNKKKMFGCGYLSPEKRQGVKRKIDYNLPSTSLQSQSVQDIIVAPQDLPSTSQSREPNLQIVQDIIVAPQDLPSTSQSREPNIQIVQDIAAPQDLPSTSQSREPNIQMEQDIVPQVLSATALEAENYLLKLDLQREVNKADKADIFSFEKIANNDASIRLYTGLPHKKIFETLYNIVKDIEFDYVYKSRVEKIKKIDQLLMTLMKLRQNFPHADLAIRFKVSESTVSNIVITWIHVLYEILFKQLMDHIPDRNKNKTCLPNSFTTFTNCRIILDCTEIFIAVVRKSMLHQKDTYSSYKHRNTFKGLIGTAPNGVITFVSDLYVGSTSDKNIVKDCGILDKLNPGDLILADKGFLIGDILPPGVNLNIPPFLVTNQFTTMQIQQTQTIARARIHVERAIRRMKCYKILDLIPHTLSKYADIIFKVIAALTNLQYPLIKETESLFMCD